MARTRLSVHQHGDFEAQIGVELFTRQMADEHTHLFELVLVDQGGGKAHHVERRSPTDEA